MNNEEVGKYIKLLCLQHQQGHLEENDFYSICNKNDYKIIKKFVKDKKGLYFNERMDEEINKRNAYSKSRSQNKLGKIKKKQKIISKSYDLHMGNENENINNIYNTNIKYNKYGTYKRVILSKEQYNKLIEEYGKEKMENQIVLLDEYVQSKNNKYT